jgi:hypothetical protein
VGFLRSVASLRNSSKNTCRGGILAGTGGSKAAFFCLLFFAAAKKSRCRPAQGQRLKHRYETADASEDKNKKPKNQKTKKPDPSSTRPGLFPITTSKDKFV